MSDPKHSNKSRRREKVHEYARVLPVLGAVLVFLPLLWPQGTGGTLTSGAGIYLFAIWLIVILGAALLSWFLRHTDKGGSDAEL